MYGMPEYMYGGPQQPHEHYTSQVDSAGNWSVEIGKGKGDVKYYGYQNGIEGRDQSDNTYVRVKKLPKLDPIIIDDNIDNNQSILRGKGYPRSESINTQRK